MPEFGQGSMVVFSDLDATLLDHETYSWAAASQALDWLQENGLPLVLCSSKTLAEMQVIHRELALTAPMVTENGAAVATPPSATRWTGTSTPWAPATPRCWPISAPCARSTATISAALAIGVSTRWCSTPALPPSKLPCRGSATAPNPSCGGIAPSVLRTSKQRWRQPVCALSPAGVFCTSWVVLIRPMACSGSWRSLNLGEPTVVALGDSPNDAAMLSAADIAVVINSPRAEQLAPTARQVIRTSGHGPVGWQEAMDQMRGQSEF